MFTKHPLYVPGKHWLVGDGTDTPQISKTSFALKALRIKWVGDTGENLTRIYE